MTQEDRMTFDVVVGPDCSDNSITLVTPIVNTIYDIKPTADFVNMTPFFKLSNLSGCALKCELQETGVVPAGYNNSGIHSFNSSNGRIVLSTSNIALHGTSMELTVKCTDPVSKSAKASD